MIMQHNNQMSEKNTSKTEIQKKDCTYKLQPVSLQSQKFHRSQPDMHEKIPSVIPFEQLETQVLRWIQFTYLTAITLQDMFSSLEAPQWHIHLNKMSLLLKPY